MQVVVVFDLQGSDEEPHIILELSASCVRHAQPRASSVLAERGGDGGDGEGGGDGGSDGGGVGAGLCWPECASEAHRFVSVSV